MGMHKNQRWYKGFTHKGHPKQLIELVSKKVIEHDLSNFIPLIRVEKKQKELDSITFLLLLTTLLLENYQNKSKII